MAARPNPRIELAKSSREEVIPLLNQMLADLYDLHSQVKQAHWNIRGPGFIGLHKLFDELAAMLEKPADNVAERAVTLGGVAQGTVRMTSKASRLEELPSKFDESTMVSALADRYAMAGSHAKDAIKACDELDDPVSADLFTDVCDVLDKSLYFLEAHLGGNSRRSN